MIRRLAILIALIIISDAYCNVIIKTTSLSVARNTVASVQVGTKAYFVGGFTYDQVGSDVIDIFDMETNQWNGTFTFPNSSRAAVTTVSNGTHLFFVAGHDFVNQPLIYNGATRKMDLMEKSGPTARTVSGLSMYNSTGIVYGATAIDFLDLTTRTWSTNKEITELMRRSNTYQFAFNTDQYIFIGGKSLNYTLWRFEIGSEARTKYDNVTFEYSSLIKPEFKYSLFNDIMVMHTAYQVVANQISTNKLYQLTIYGIIGSSSIVDKTMVFNASGYYTIDWPSETSTWTDQPGIYITFGGPGYAAYCQTVTSTTSNICLYTNINPQGACASATMSSNIIGQVALGATKNLLWSTTNVYLYDSSTNTVIGFAETYQNIKRVIPFGDNFYVFDDISGTIQMNTYTQVTNNNFNHESATASMLPDAIVGNDFISGSQGVVGPELNAQSPFSLSLPNDRVYAYSNDHFLVMNIQSQKLFYNQIDVYNLVAEKWEDPIIPGFTFSTDSYVRAAVLNNSIFLWLYNSIEVYDLQTGTWDSIATDVLVTGEDSPNVEIPPVIVNDTALLRADPEMRFYWFQPRDSWTPIGPAVPLDKEPQVALFQYSLINDVIYVVKKGSKQPYYSLIYYYDMSVGDWNSFSLQVAVDNVTVVMATVNNFIAFFGDQLLQSYHIPTGTWNLTALPQTVVFSTVLQTDRNITILAGGTLITGDPTDIVYLLTDDAIEPTAPPSTPNTQSDPVTSTPTTGSSGLSSGELAAAIVVPVGVAVIAGVLLAVLLMRRQKKRKGAVSTIGLEAKYGEWYTPFSDITFGQQLGQGASGQVFSGTWKSTKVALKVSATQANQTVINELELMITLRPHPNVVQLLGFSVHPETHNVILIIEFCNQGSLASTLYDEKKDVSMEQKMSWLVGIGKGLSHLHANNIVHRDVAARNVLLHQGEAKITDFGMSRLIEDQKQHGTTKSELGPIRWMAPESIRAKQYSAKSDVWSFGILMYEVISRQEPHSSADPIEIGRLIRDQGLTPSIPSSCPAELSTLMKECWKMNAEQRPNIDDVVNQLENSSFI